MYFTVNIVAVQHLTVELCEVDAIPMEKVPKLQTGVKPKRFHPVFFAFLHSFPKFYLWLLCLLWSLVILVVSQTNIKSGPVHLLTKFTEQLELFYIFAWHMF